MWGNVLEGVVNDKDWMRDAKALTEGIDDSGVKSLA